MTQIPSNPVVDSALRPPPVNRFSEMSSEDFLRIIFTELSNQDPFEPNDSSALLDQLNSIRSIESDIQLIDQLKSLVTDNQFAWAANLIGKHITGLSTTNDPVEGRVVSVVRQGEEVSLELDNGWLVPIGSVQTVNEAAP